MSHAECASSHVSRSPSPSDYNRGINYPKQPAAAATNQTSSYRYNSRSPSPVLQFRPGASQMPPPTNRTARQLPPTTKAAVAVVTQPTANIQMNATDAAAASHHQQLRKLPPIPMKKTQEFEMNNVMMPVPNQPAGGRRMPVINQPSKVNLIQKIQQVNPAGRALTAHHDTVKLTKQYASIGDDDSDENENWL
jgi:hypothetical protein